MEMNGYTTHNGVITGIVKPENMMGDGSEIGMRDPKQMSQFAHPGAGYYYLPGPAPGYFVASSVHNSSRPTEHTEPRNNQNRSRSREEYRTEEYRTHTNNYRGRGRGRGRGRNNFHAYERNGTQSTRFCFKCAQTGHVTKSCKLYKTSICKFWRNPACRFESNSADCNHAHGEEELRAIADVYCVRIEYDDGKQLITGCLQPGHKKDNCPLSGVNSSTNDSTTNTTTTFEKEFGDDKN